MCLMRWDIRLASTGFLKPYGRIGGPLFDCPYWQIRGDAWEILPALTKPHQAHGVLANRRHQLMVVYSTMTRHQRSTK